MQLTLDIFDNEAVLFTGDTKKMKPEEMTLSMFMSEPAWRAVLDEKATGETKGMYHMIQPDGSSWRGGWIGKFRNEELAKRDFHYKQLYWAIFRGSEIAESVLQDYKKLLTVQRSIHKHMDNIHIQNGPYLTVTVGSERRYFHIKDFPMYCRVSVREFIRDHELLQLAPGESWYGSGDDGFGPVEEMAIALERKLSKLLKKDHRPHFLLQDNRLSFGSTDIKVVLRIPEIIKDGVCTKYRLVEGVTVYSAGSCVARVEYKEEDTSAAVRIGLRPSLLHQIGTDTGWREVKPI
ncbi:hypothetical protein [Paenibacillus prosopidis]|uniref:Uncharacterized protein n=1 Tax=Paenibacillus prosopidis TaxID=630520 RepID=A0A368VJT5_9BACL|nr:hypothetical protein [Paenibacillus prosopidis]RCW41588.1 hypothetical protein DFP97_12224 [Paenibacillus prosopidis]